MCPGAYALRLANWIAWCLCFVLKTRNIIEQFAPPIRTLQIDLSPSEFGHEIRFIDDLEQFQEKVGVSPRLITGIFGRIFCRNRGSKS
jgi:hypothetical protein